MIENVVINHRAAQGLNLHFVENEASGATESRTEDILPFPCIKSATWPWLWSQQNLRNHSHTKHVSLFAAMETGQNYSFDLPV